MRFFRRRRWRPSTEQVATVPITADPSGFEEAMTDASTSMRRLGWSMRRSGRLWRARRWRTHDPAFAGHVPHRGVPNDQLVVDLERSRM